MAFEPWVYMAVSLKHTLRGNIPTCKSSRHGIVATYTPSGITHVTQTQGIIYSRHRRVTKHTHEQSRARNISKACPVGHE